MAGLGRTAKRNAVLFGAACSALRAGIDGMSGATRLLRTCRLLRKHSIAAALSKSRGTLHG
jgi:hypothetical protein